MQGWVQFHMELGIGVINSNYTGIGIEIIFNPRIGIGIEYFLEKVMEFIRVIGVFHQFLWNSKDIFFFKNKLFLN